MTSVSRGGGRGGGREGGREGGRGGHMTTMYIYDHIGNEAIHAQCLKSHPSLTN